MKIDLSNVNFNSVELVFKNGVTINIDQHSDTSGVNGEPCHGVVVRAGNGDFNPLQNLHSKDAKHLNPNGDRGFILTRVKVAK